MPTNKQALTRYRIIDSMINNRQRPFPSLVDLMEACSEQLGVPVKKRTLQKDIEDMREDTALGYHAPIRYSREHNGYFYEYEWSMTDLPLTDLDLEALAFATTSLKHYKDVPIFKDFTHAIEKIFNAIHMDEFLGAKRTGQFVQFEHNPPMDGGEFIAPIVDCIRNGYVVAFDYKPFDSQETQERRVHPYLLKEYKGRWYLIGMSDYYRDRIPTYALDRMSNVHSTEDRRENHPTFKPKVYYKHAYGITVTDEPVEEVVLSFTPKQGQYVKTQPLHPTQKELKDTKKEYRIQLDVYITFELVMDILGYGKDVKVVKPRRLAKKVSALLLEAANKY